MIDQVAKTSKRLSWLLRHGAGEAGLTMDEAGWAEVTDVLGILKMSRAELDLAVAENDKGRLVVIDGRIRACQGHSLDDMPVTLEVLEASWERISPSRSLWHGTRVSAMEGIRQSGIGPGRRSHVHLASAPDSHVGKRSSVDVLIEVNPRQLEAEGIAIFRAPNGVILARHVPASAIGRFIRSGPQTDGPHDVGD